MGLPLRRPIASQADAEQAQREARALARAHGFSPVEVEAVALAVAELATNLLRYARGGVISLTWLAAPAGGGIEVVCEDSGPGIADLAQALTDGFSTGGGLGSGLPGVRRLMDTFEIASSPEGTRIVACKWTTRPT